MMDDDLPPLPDGRIVRREPSGETSAWPPMLVNYYSEEDMHAYARAAIAFYRGMQDGGTDALVADLVDVAVAEEREATVEWLIEQGWIGEQYADDVRAAIRARGLKP